jgi:hypothetical protein
MAKAKKSSKKSSKPDYIDLDKDGNKKESMKKAAKDAKNSKKKKVVKENVLISNFIKCISEENYAEANKYLMQVIEDKIMKRISQSIKPTLF